MQNIILE